ncbi:hypothetical protein QJS04_geneDACA015720 [Acorus gramineus]|uniref:Uncharacterized protein n=1 Tax=Acorus gramineus TaxID=55184 RepID=A0AAV9BPM0_ACOGR|nr:hypothetical protein QJS04_geneDACA015720 [Acorus gramineus]
MHPDTRLQTMKLKLKFNTWKRMHAMQVDPTTPLSLPPIIIIIMTTSKSMCGVESHTRSSIEWLLLRGRRTLCPPGLQNRTRPSRRR